MDISLALPCRNTCSIGYSLWHCCEKRGRTVRSPVWGSHSCNSWEGSRIQFAGSIQSALGMCAGLRAFPDQCTCLEFRACTFVWECCGCQRSVKSSGVSPHLDMSPGVVRVSCTTLAPLLNAHKGAGRAHRGGLWLSLNI